MKLPNEIEVRIRCGTCAVPVSFTISTPTLIPNGNAGDWITRTVLAFGTELLRVCRVVKCKCNQPNGQSAADDE